jgi:uncharacterized delta-60 repeat protein
MHHPRHPSCLSRAADQAVAALIESLESRRLFAAGDLDPTFGAGGTLRFPYKQQVGTETTANGVIAQGDGKIIVVGSTGPRDNADTDFFVARFQANGSMDRSFGVGGVVRTDVSKGGADVAYGVIVGGNGKITVVGSAVEGSETEAAIVRYNPNGTLDTTFSGDGIRTTGYAGRADIAYDVLIDSAGRIVFVGGTGSDFLIGRLKSNGDNDTSFNRDGLDQAGFGGTEAARGVAVLPNGNIVAGGSTTNGAGGSDFAAVLYNPTTGNRVSGFGTDGKRKVDLFGQRDAGWGVAVDTGGRIVLGGTSDVDIFDSIAAVRLNPADASFDTSFGGDGIVIAASRDRVGSDAEGGGVFTSGRVVTIAGGWLSEADTQSPERESTVARFTPIGSPDTTFGPGGAGVFRVGGTIVGIGPAPGAETVYAQRFPISARIGVSRLNASGTAKAGFGEDGEGTATLPSAFGRTDTPTNLVLLPDGRALLPGTYLTQLSLIRYNANGSIDTGFGTNGRVLVDVPQISADPDEEIGFFPTGAHLQPDGRLLVDGTMADVGRGVSVGGAVVRFNPNGTLDMTFGGGDGILTAFTPDDSGSDGLRVLPDGKFILVTDDAGFNYTYMRYDADGTPDTSFQPFTFDPERSGQMISAPIIEFAPDGKLVGGGTDEGPDEQPTTALFRLNTDGTLDTTFSGDGVLWDYPDGTAGDELPGDARTSPSVIVQSDGKLLLGFQGEIDGDTEPTTGDVGLMRLAADGTIDSTFGSGGTVTLDFGGIDVPSGVPVLQSDGKILVPARKLAPGERFFDRDRALQFGVARLNTDGTPDQSFGGGDGFVVHTFGVGERASLDEVAGNSVLIRRSFPPSSVDGGTAFSRMDLGAGGGTGGPSIAIEGGILTARGTSGNDAIAIRRSGGDDVIVTVNSLSRQFDMDDFTAVLLDGLGGDDVLRITDAITAGAITRKVTLDGGAGDDSLTGNAGDDVLRGGEGLDTLIGLAGRDALAGGAGNDQLFGGLGLDFLDGGDDDDFIDATDSAAGDTVLGGNGADTARVDAGDSFSSVETLA